MMRRTGKMIKNYLTYINESTTYRDYNKNIKYKIINYINGTEFKSVDVNYLNEYFTGWCILTDELNDFLLHITKWTNKSVLYYDKYYHQNNLSSIFIDTSYNLNKHVYILYKIEIEGPKYNRKYNDLDPYGEEDWGE